MTPIDDTRIRNGIRVRTLAVLVGIAFLGGCESTVDDRAERCDRPHTGTYAHSLRNTDVYGNEVSTR